MLGRVWEDWAKARGAAAVVVRKCRREGMGVIYQRACRGAKMNVMKTVTLPRARTQRSKQDPHYPAAVERAKEAVRRLQQAGIIDAEGRRIRTDLPTDMQEGQDRDFGG